MVQPAFSARYGPWALVTGASRGIGHALALALARRTVNVVLCGRDSAALDSVLAQVVALGVQARCVTADLAQPTDVERLVAAVADVEVGLLVCNAAQAHVGMFSSATAESSDQIVRVNCLATTQLCHALVPSMVSRGRGGVVILSSLSGLMGSAGMATYAASKAFDLVLAESLWAELRPHGVDALAVMAGATRTPGFTGSAPNMPGALAPSVMEPAAVAEQALLALGKVPTMVPGAANRLGAFIMQRLLSRRRAAEIMRYTARRMYGARIDG